MKQILICIIVFLSLFQNCKAQSRDALEQYLVKNLSYQQVNHPQRKDSHITIYQIEFKGCTMTYSIQVKEGNNIQRYTIRTSLSGISKITTGTNSDGYTILTFTTGGKSIVKEYPDGKLVHEQLQFIPMIAKNQKALTYFNKLKDYCKNK